MATTLDSYSESNQDNGVQQYPGSASASGQSFITPNDGNSYGISSAKFYLKKTGAPTGNAVAKLYAHSGTYGSTSVPGILLATSGNYDVTALTTSYQLIEFTFPVQYRLAPNTHYVITYEHAGTDSSNFTWCGGDSSSPSHGGNSMYNSSGWIALAAWDICFYVYGIVSDIVPDATSQGQSGASDTSYNLAHTMSSAAYRIIFAHIFLSAGDVLLTAKYAGVDMTLISKDNTSGAGGPSYLYYIITPTTGTNNIAVTTSAGGYIVVRGSSYTASHPIVLDTSTHGQGTTTPKTVSLTTIADNSWVVLVASSQRSLAASTGSTLKTGGANDQFEFYDSNGPRTPAGNVDMAYTVATTPYATNYVMASFTTVTATTYNQTVAASGTGVAKALKGITAARTTIHASGVGSGKVSKAITAARATIHAIGVGTAKAIKAITAARTTIHALGTGLAVMLASKAYLQTLTTTASAVAILTKVPGKVLHSTGNGLATVVKGVQKNVHAIGAGTATVTKQVGKALHAIAAGTATVGHAILMTLHVTASATATIIKTPHKILKASGVGHAVMMHYRGVIMHASAAGHAVVVKTPRKLLGVIASAVGRIHQDFWRTKYPAQDDQYGIKYPYGE